MSLQSVLVTSHQSERGEELFKIRDSCSCILNDAIGDVEKSAKIGDFFKAAVIEKSVNDYFKAINSVLEGDYSHKEKISYAKTTIEFFQNGLQKLRQSPLTSIEEQRLSFFREFGARVENSPIIGI